MATKDEVIGKLRQETPSVTAAELYKRVQSGAGDLTIIDVREQDEHAQGFVPGALYIPRTFLELRIEDTVKDKDRDIVVYCAAGVRSLFAAKALRELGYSRVLNLEGGFNGWKNAGLPFEMKRTDSRARSTRYSRHLLVPEVGEEGQEKLLRSRVFILGAGGLGCPAAIYLAAAGVGTIGVVDSDLVDESNLQRQVIHRTIDIGRPKVDSAREFIKNLNPDIAVVQYREHLSADNIYPVLDDGWDVLVNGCDNFPTRYLVNDACYFRKVTIVDGSIFRFEGQVTVYRPDAGPCYRCLYPEPPPPDLAPSCAEAGVLGILPGVVGTLQATETIKILLGIGDPLLGRLLYFDALGMHFHELKLSRDPRCPLCGEHPTVTDLIDYEWFCSAEARAQAVHH